MDPFLGEIRLFSFGFAPKGWAFCNGAILPVNQYNALFALLGTMYGGNGVQTFALPDLRGRTPIHRSNQEPQGALDGTENVTLTIATMPMHTHLMYGTSTQADVKAPTNHYFANDTAPNADFYAAPGALVPIASQTITNTGGSQPHSNMQPYLVMNHCIATSGIFPSRN